MNNIPENISPKFKNLESFLVNSSFIREINDPCENSLIPKGIIYKPYNNNLRCKRTNYSLRNLKWKSININKYKNDREILIKISGNFILDEEKHYYFGNCADMPFYMIDNGEFKSYIDVNFNSVVVISEASIIRNIVGNNFDNASVRDYLFKAPHKDCKFKINVKDFYIPLADSNKLLHFSNLSNCFEVFVFNSQFKVLNGLDTSQIVERKVYDNLASAENDFEYNQINYIISQFNKCRIHTKKKQ